VFLVGGAVRDALAGAVARNANVVTTMPIDFLYPLCHAMYGAPTAIDVGARVNGVLRVGSPSTTNAYLEISTFKDSAIGTPDAVFADSFDSDIAFRDFACNTLYYEPVNDVLIDPTGFGARDAVAKQLRIVCDTSRCTTHQLAQAALRYCRFRRQGYELIDEDNRMARDFLPRLREMPELNRIGYFRTQVFIGVSDTDQHAAFDALKLVFEELGVPEVWRDAVAPIRDEILTP
jgi:hypothetical protein